MVSFLQGLFFVLLLAIGSMSQNVQREKRILPSTCGLPCAVEGNHCLNGGVCQNFRCVCTSGTGDLPSCGGLPCFREGNRCLFSSKRCTRCIEGLRCN